MYENIKRKKKEKLSSCYALNTDVDNFFTFGPLSQTKKSPTFFRHKHK